MKSPSGNRRHLSVVDAIVEMTVEAETRLSAAIRPIVFDGQERRAFDSPRIRLCPLRGAGIVGEQVIVECGQDVMSLAASLTLPTFFSVLPSVDWAFPLASISLLPVASPAASRMLPAACLADPLSSCLSTLRNSPLAWYGLHDGERYATTTRSFVIPVVGDRWRPHVGSHCDPF